MVWHGWQEGNGALPWSFPDSFGEEEDEKGARIVLLNLNGNYFKKSNTSSWNALCLKPQAIVKFTLNTCSTKKKS